MTRTTTAGTAARQECRFDPSVMRENCGRVSVTVVSMAATVLTGEQKGNPTTARAILRIAATPESRSERQADAEVRVGGLGRLLPVGAQVRVGRSQLGVAATRRAATAGVGLSRHGALLYSTLLLPATTHPAGWRRSGFPVTTDRKSTRLNSSH